jgi:hypothetical protein
MEPSVATLLGLLAEGKVVFVIVGGVAVTLHGYVRLAEDMDLLVWDDPEVLGACCPRHGRRLFGQGFVCELKPSDFNNSKGATRIVEATGGCLVGIFTRMTGERFEDVVADAACGARRISRSDMHPGEFRLPGRNSHCAKRICSMCWPSGNCWWIQPHLTGTVSP